MAKRATLLDPKPSLFCLNFLFVFVSVFVEGLRVR